MRPTETPGHRYRVDAVRLQLEAVLLGAVEAAALAAARLVGHNDQQATKAAAAQAMLEALDQQLEVGTRLVLTPGGDAILSPGSLVGRGSDIELDLAVYPVEAAGLAARGLPGAVSIVIAAQADSFPQLPPVAYIEKLVVGPAARGGIDLEDTLVDNLRRVAFARDCRVSDLVVAVLDRPRHQELMEEVRSTGARLLLVEDGEVAAATAAAIPDSNIDVMLGVGGLQEAVMAGSILHCLGGDMQARLWPRNDEELILAGAETNRVYRGDELAPNEVIAAVAGITDGPLLRGVRRGGGWAETSSLVLSNRSATLRHVTTRHNRPLDS